MKETMELIKEVKEFVEEAVVKSADGKFSIGELFGFSDNILGIYTEAQDFELIKTEISKMDETNIKDLSGELISIIFNVIKIVNNLKGTKGD